MGIFSSLEGNWPPAPHDDFWYSSPLTMAMRDGGVDVRPETAIALTAVWCAVNTVAGTLGALPAILYRKRDASGRARDRAEDHPLYGLLRWQPNPYQTAAEFFRMGQEHLMLRGNAISWVQRDPTTQSVTGFLPWHPDRVQMGFVNGHLFYYLRRTDGSEVVLPMEDVWHVRGPHGTGLWAISPIAAHAQSIGFGLAAEAYGARFFRNDTTPNLVMKHPAKLDDKARGNLKKSWNESQGGKNQHSIALLEEGITVEKISVTPEEAQFLESRRFSVTDVARIYGVHPSFLMELTNAHYNNVEHENLAMLTYTMTPVAVHWEQQAARTLFPMGAGGLFLEFLMDALLRGDSKTRQEAQEVQWRSGALTLDEWRANEGRNPYGGEAGSTPWVPANMMPAALALVPPTAGEEPAPGNGEDEEEEDDEPTRTARTHLTRAGGQRVKELRAGQVRSLAGRLRLRDSYGRILKRTAEQIVKREVTAVRRMVTASQGSTPEFNSRIAAFYEEFEGTVRNLWRPTMESYAEQAYAEGHREAGGDGNMPKEDEAMMATYVDTAALRHVSASRGQLEQIVRENEDWGDKVRTRLDEWEANRPGKMAARERVQGGEFFVLLAFAAMNVRHIRWVTFGGSCELCNDLSGKVVGTETPFLAEGQSAGSEDKRIEPRRPVRHAPLHGGCDCAIVAED